MQILLLNKLDCNTFGKASLIKFCITYFRKNKWIIKYIDEDYQLYLTKTTLILLWFQQQVSVSNKLKKGKILKTLIDKQPKYKYTIIDYIEDIHRSHNSFGINKSFYNNHFNKNNKYYNHMLVRYENGIKRVYPDCNYYCLPFSINSTIIPKFNYTPKEVILLTGKLKPKNYPLRFKISKMKYTHPIEVLNHPTYKKLEHNLVGQRYVSYINNYLISISTCGSKEFNYIVSKYFEIPASGALLFAYIEPIKELLTSYGFIDGVNMISFNYNNLNERIKYILDPKNREDINKIRLNGYKLVKRRHTHHTRFYVELDSFIKKLKNNI